MPSLDVSLPGARRLATAAALSGACPSARIVLTSAGGWALLFAVHTVSANAHFLPGQFTGTAFNFPLDLVTTVAELFTGFGPL